MPAPRGWGLAGWCGPTTMTALRRVALVCAYTLACGGGDSAVGPGQRAAFQISTLPAPTCIAGQALSQPLTVLVIDSTRQPLAGVLVHFRVVVGQGALASDTARTKADGKASVGFTCGPGNANVEASVTGISSPATFFIVTNPGPLAHLGGLPLGAPAVAGKAIDLYAFPQDQFGRSTCVSSTATVTWTVKSGGGSLAAASTPVQPWGKVCAALNTWTLGSQLGPQAITLTVPEVPGFVDSAGVRAVSGPIQLIRFGSDSVFGTVAQPIPTAFRVQAVTPEGVPLPNADVQFNAGFFGLGVPAGFQDQVGILSTTSGGAACPQGERFCIVGSDVAGFAQIFFAPGPKTEPPDIIRQVYAYVVTLGSTSQPEVAWTVVALPGPPVAVIPTAGNNQSGAVGFPVGPLQVKVADAYENGVPGQSVSWLVTSGGGTLASSPTTTDAAGLASNVWTLGPVAGSQSVTASISGGAHTTFTALASP